MEIETNSLKSGNSKQSDFLAFLHVEFSRRKYRNPHYSLRAFAKNLNVDQSLLSKIFRGQRSLSEQMIFKMALALNMPETEIRQYLSQDDNKSFITRYRKLSEEELSLMSDWYPFAILELAQTVGFQPNVSWIAGRLGLSENEVSLSISKLQYNRLIAIDQTGNWQLLSYSSTWSDSKSTNLARKKLQKQFLQKAEVAIDTYDIGVRENLSMTIAVNPLAVPEVKRRINKFNEELRNYINSYDTQEEVYQVLLSFFPLTARKNKEAI